MDRDLAEKIVNEVIAITEADQFATQLEDAIKAIFPRSGVKARFSSGITNSITVWFMLQGDPSKHANKIAQNDPAHQILHIWIPNSIDARNGKLAADTKLTVENKGASLLVQPAPGSCMAYDSIKLGWRKKSGNPAAILKHVTNYFSKVKRVVHENFDRLPKSFQSEGLGL